MRLPVEVDERRNLQSIVIDEFTAEGAHQLVTLSLVLSHSLNVDKFEQRFGLSKDPERIVLLFRDRYAVPRPAAVGVIVEDELLAPVGRFLHRGPIARMPFDEPDHLLEHCGALYKECRKTAGVRHADGIV
jgi:hypothetical protein